MPAFAHAHPRERLEVAASEGVSCLSASVGGRDWDGRRAKGNGLDLPVGERAWTGRHANGMQLTAPPAAGRRKGRRRARLTWRSALPMRTAAAGATAAPTATSAAGGRPQTTAQGGAQKDNAEKHN
ncbi:hypothetical protein SODG_006714 [Sodalis praecaptivus]